MEQAVEVETEIYLGEPWVLSGLLSHMELKYKESIENALVGVFKLAGSIAQHSTKENLEGLFREFEWTLSTLSLSPNLEFRGMVE